MIGPGDLQEGSIVKVNGDEGKIPKQTVGVVWQDDLLLSNLTVEENIYFAARLKTPESTSNIAVRTVVDETIAELGLAHVRDSLVGCPFGPPAMRCVSGGERKRVSVGVESYSLVRIRYSCRLSHPDHMSVGFFSTSQQVG